jgi:hypothetical protein
LLSKNLANRFGVGEQRVTGKLQAFDRALSGFIISSAASVKQRTPLRSAKEQAL